MCIDITNYYYFDFLNYSSFILNFLLQLKTFLCKEIILLKCILQNSYFNNGVKRRNNTICSIKNKGNYFFGPKYKVI